MVRVKKTLTAEEKLTAALVPAEEQPYEIPKNWCWVKLGMLLYPQETKKPDGKSFRYIDIDAVDNVSQVVHTPKLLLSEKAPSRASRKLHAGDVIFSLVRPYLRNIAYIDDSLSDCIASTGFYVCQCRNALFSKYLYRNLCSQGTINYLTGYMKGDNSPSIRKENLENMPVPLPPLAEQQRIVARIEALFRRLDEAEEKIQYALDSFDKRRSALLARAFSGKLVIHRKSYGTAEELYQKIKKEKLKLLSDKKEKAMAPISDNEKPFHIPDTWKWVRWGELAESIQYGYNAPAKKSGRIKMVRISDIQNGHVDWNTVPYCVIDEKDVSKYVLKKNDILFARTGATVGKSFLVESVPENVIYAGYLIRTQYSSLLPPKYLKYFMDSPFYWIQLHNGTTATAQPNCNGTVLGNMIFPLPPLEEQKEIVRILDEAFAREDEAREAAERALAAIPKLRRAILARAFRGQLGTGDPSDEDARALLARTL